MSAVEQAAQNFDRIARSALSSPPPKSSRSARARAPMSTRDTAAMTPQTHTAFSSPDRSAACSASSNVSVASMTAQSVGPSYPPLARGQANRCTNSDYMGKRASPARISSGRRPGRCQRRCDETLFGKVSQRRNRTGHSSCDVRPRPRDLGLLPKLSNLDAFKKRHWQA